MRIILTKTDGKYNSLGKWVAQLEGLPQARTYGINDLEALGKLILTFGKENGVVILPTTELDPQRKKMQK